MTDEKVDWEPNFNPSCTPFLAGIPFVGFQSRTIKRIRGILSGRNLNDTLNQWLSIGYDADDVKIFCTRVFELTKTWTHWPNQFFSPDDNARILLGYIHGLGVEEEDVIRPLCKMYSSKGRVRSKVCTVLFGLLNGMSMRELLSCLESD